MNDKYGNKTRSTDLISTNKNSYVNNINKNIIPINGTLPLQNKMNILPDKPEEKRLESKINFKVVRILLIIIFLIAIISFIFIYTKEKQPNNENKIILFYIKEGFIDPEEFCSNKNINCQFFNEKNNLRRIEEYNSSNNNLMKVEMSIHSKLSNLSSMFKQHYNLISTDLTIKSPFINDMSHTFENCSNLKYINLSSFNGHNIKSMNSLFKGCYDLTNITGLEKLDTSFLDDIEGMFAYCKKLNEVDLSSFNLSKITNINNIFDNNESLEKIKLNNKSDEQYLNKIFNMNYFSNKTILIEINNHSENLSEIIQRLNKTDKENDSDEKQNRTDEKSTTTYITNIISTTYITTIPTTNLKTIPITIIPKNKTNIITTFPITINTSNPETPFTTFPTTISTTNTKTLFTTFPTTINTSNTKTLFTTFPTTIITSNPKTLFTTFPTTIITINPTSTITSILKTIITNNPTTTISSILKTIITTFPKTINSNITNIKTTINLSTIIKTNSTYIITTNPKNSSKITNISL